MAITEFFDYETLSISRMINNQTLEILKWSATTFSNKKLTLQLYFNDKFEISFSESETLRLDILQPDIFVDYENYTTIFNNSNNTLLFATLPKQDSSHKVYIVLSRFANFCNGLVLIVFAITIAIYLILSQGLT